MTTLRALRLLCGYRQIDITFGTGIPPYKVSAAEKDVSVLSSPEKELLRAFFIERLQQRPDCYAIGDELATLFREVSSPVNATKTPEDSGFVMA
jgi:hypothetical protein